MSSTTNSQVARLQVAAAGLPLRLTPQAASASTHRAIASRSRMRLGIVVQ